MICEQVSYQYAAVVQKWTILISSSAQGAHNNPQTPQVLVYSVW